MTEEALQAIGFDQATDGKLQAPVGSTVVLIPIDRNYYRVTVELADGSAVVCVVAKCALRTRDLANE